VTAGVVLAAVAAVLLPHEVAVVDTAGGTVARRSTLPGEGLAVFAAPDARVLVPLADRDLTAVVEAGGKVSTWPGRIFPLFFDEIDRMRVVMAGSVATLSYPERLLLFQVDVAGLRGARRAACSRDGRLVVVAPADGSPNTLFLVAADEGGGTLPVVLSAEPKAVAAAPDGAWAAAALADGSVVMVGMGTSGVRGIVRVAGSATSLAASADGRALVVGVADGGRGRIAVLRIDARSDRPLKERSLTPTDGPVTAVEVSGDEVIALVGDALEVFGKLGRKELRVVPMPGARALSLLPDHPASILPQWSDR
jgi:hypothetical protein